MVTTLFQLSVPEQQLLLDVVRAHNIAEKKL